ncbi:hypothetical protein, partial [Xanthomonas vesicatoria]|uniref:hypothetical protein n=1 Tax=Xanthomonas vesicatoria TaxID=56460 RepID=UPI001E3B9F0A
DITGTGSQRSRDAVTARVAGACPSRCATRCSSICVRYHTGRSFGAIGLCHFYRITSTGRACTARSSTRSSRLARCADLSRCDARAPTNVCACAFDVTPKARRVRRAIN